MITTEELQKLEADLERETKNLLRLQAIGEQRERKLEEDRQEVRNLGYDPDHLDEAIIDLEDTCMTMLAKLQSDFRELVEQREKYDKL